MKVNQKVMTYSAVQWFKLGDHSNVTLLPGCADHGVLETATGADIISPGDWILEDEAGHFTRCRENDFKALYKEVE